MGPIAPLRIHLPMVVMDSGLAAARRPGMTAGEGNVLQIRHDGQITSILRNRVKPQSGKYFALPEFWFAISLPPSRAHMRDVSRSSRYVGHGMRWTLRRQAG